MAEKKLDPWLPSDLTRSLEYKQPDYSNLWGAPAGTKPTYHSQTMGRGLSAVGIKAPGT
jgi:hypothetical protein